jgi:hypothetical protein
LSVSGFGKPNAEFAHRSAKQSLGLVTWHGRQIMNGLLTMAAKSSSAIAAHLIPRGMTRFSNDDLVKGNLGHACSFNFKDLDAN